MLLLIIAHQSTVPEVIGRYTRLYAGGIGLSFLLVIAVLVGGLRGQRHVASLLARIPYLWGIVGALALLALTTAAWILPFDAQLITLLLTFNAACLGMWIVFSAPPDEGQNRLWGRVLVCALALLLLIGLFSAHRVPQEESAGDEPTLADIGVTWLHTGDAYLRIVALKPVSITPGFGYWTTLLADWMRVVGVTLASGRLFMGLLDVFVVLAIAAAGWKLYDGWVGLFAGVLAAASPYLLSYRIIRPDLGLPFFGAVIFLLYLSKRPTLSLLAGWLAVLSLEFHASGIAYIVGAGGLYATDLLLRRNDPLRFKRFGLFVTGGIIGSVIYVLLHILILPDPGYYFSYLRDQRGFLRGFYFLDWLQSSFQLYWDRSPLELIFTAIALVGLLLRRSPCDRLLLRFWLLCLIAYFLFVPQFFRYLVFFAPFICIGTAAFVRYAFDKVAAAPRLLGSAVALFGLCSPFLAASIPALSIDVLAADPMPAQVARVRDLSDPSAVVAGDMNTYWWFQDYAAFYGNGAEYEHTVEIGRGDTSLWPKLNPDIVFFTAYPGNPTMAVQIKQWLQDGQYALIDTVQSGGFTTLIWQRPGYRPRQNP